MAVVHQAGAPAPGHRRLAHAATALWLQPLPGVAKKLPLGDISPSWAFWVDVFVGRQGEIAFTGVTPTQPSELYYMRSANDAPRRLTDFNHQIASLALGKAEKL